MVDLDLVIEGAGPMSIAQIAALAEAFDESSLRFKVDLVDRHAIEGRFAAIVDATRRDLG